MTDSRDLAGKIVEATPDAVVFADREGMIRLWNAGAVRIFGYTADEAVGRSLDIIIPENLQERHWEGYRKTMESGQTRYGAGDLLAVPAVRKDGSRISIEFSIALLQDETGVGAVAVIRDVTAGWNEQRDLRRRLAELEKNG
jgi:PAS domain S-box-containing protein